MKIENLERANDLRIRYNRLMEAKKFVEKYASTGYVKLVSAGHEGAKDFDLYNEPILLGVITKYCDDTLKSLTRQIEEL